MNDASSRRRVQLWAGVVLLLLFILLTKALRTGPREFAYIPFTPAPLPWAPMRGFTVEQAADHAARILLLGPALALLAFAIAGRKIEQLAERISLRKAAITVSALSLCFIAFVLFFVLRGRPIVDDELTYTMMADTYATGHMALPLLPGLLREPFTINTRIGLTGKYLPGEALVQVPGDLIGYPALMHVLLAALILFSTFRATTLLSDERIGAWATILVAASPMFILCSATAQSQTTSLACCAVAGLGWAYVERERPWLGSILLALGVVAGVFTRLQAIAPIGTVLVLAAAWRLFRQRRFAPLVLLAGLLAAGAATLGWYDRLLTGNPLVLPWSLFTPVERYGFGQIWPTDTFHHNFWTTLQNLLVVSIRMNTWWLGWPLGVLILIFWFRMGRPLAGGGRIWMIAALLFIAVQAGYYSTGISDVGPIYHFELLIPLAIVGANTLVAARGRYPALAAAWILLNFGIGTPAFLWTQTARLDRLTHTIHDEVDAAMARLEKPAVLITEPSCTEAISLGWVHSIFPRRWRTGDHDVITWSRPLPRFVPLYIAQYPERHCYYYRRNPETWAPEIYSCKDAASLMARPIVLVNCLHVRSTAEEMGWYDPWTAIRQRTLPGKSNKWRLIREIQ